MPNRLGFQWSNREWETVDEMRTPTARELEILKVLWAHGPCSVRDVHRRLSRNSALAYNTVQTLLRIMEEKKGLVRHHVEGRTFIYTPCHSRDAMVANCAANLLERVFDGAASELVLSLLRSERISPEELDRMQAMIAEARRKRSNPSYAEGPS
jgi:predicted transcriptional regulator